ncbi:MAG: hypothetical protein PVG07_04445 [Acidobacteriota bacterium]
MAANEPGDAEQRVLGDFAPALSLLPAPERERARALTAYAAALFARARSGDDRQDEENRRARVESIDRLARALRQRLDGSPGPAGERPEPPAPGVDAMAAADRRHPWPPEALDEIAESARHRAVTPRPATRRDGFSSALRLGAALACAQLGAPQPPEVARFAGALVRLVLLQSLGSELDAGRCSLALEDLDDDVSDRAAKPDLRAIVEAVRGQCQRLRPDLLAIGKPLADLPGPYRRAASYLLLAGLRLLAELEDANSTFLTDPPKIGRLTRWGLLLQAWRGRVL